MMTDGTQQVSASMQPFEYIHYWSDYKKLSYKTEAHLLPTHEKSDPRNGAQIVASY